MDATFHSKLYKCPEHGDWLVLEVIPLSPFSRTLLNRDRVTFYRCPHVDKVACGRQRYGKEIIHETRCNYMKPNKHQDGKRTYTRWKK
jgi:hypothetical protein